MCVVLIYFKLHFCDLFICISSFYGDLPQCFAHEASFLSLNVVNLFLKSVDNLHIVCKDSIHINTEHLF